MMRQIISRYLNPELRDVSEGAWIRHETKLGIYFSYGMLLVNTVLISRILSMNAESAGNIMSLIAGSTQAILSLSTVFVFLAGFVISVTEGSKYDLKARLSARYAIAFFAIMFSAIGLIVSAITSVNLNWVVWLTGLMVVLGIYAEFTRAVSQLGKIEGWVQDSAPVERIQVLNSTKTLGERTRQATVTQSSIQPVVGNSFSSGIPSAISTKTADDIPLGPSRDAPKRDAFPSLRAKT